MHDIKKIRENPSDLDELLAKRKHPPVSNQIIELDEKNREIIGELQVIQEERNAKSKLIGEYAAKEKNDEAAKLKAEVTSLKDKMQELNMMSFEQATKISGARFVVQSGLIARMERAISNFMLDLHTNEFGYTEMNVPILVKDQSVYGVGQLPKFKDDLFKTTDDYWLIPTAEVPLSNMTRESIIDILDLPKRYVSHTPCFRSEAGAAGKDTRGMIRQHQFSKIEMVSIVHPKDSDTKLEEMTNHAEHILIELNLPYRVILLCSGDTGFSSKKTYDIEVWLPGQNNSLGQYREISSCSNCGDFQSRRMKTRVKDYNTGKIFFPHTLNGSSLAVGRILIAIIENYQSEEGFINIPKVLHKYMNGVVQIKN